VFLEGEWIGRREREREMERKRAVVRDTSSALVYSAGSDDPMTAFAHT
jgi:hypothetical protein